MAKEIKTRPPVGNWKVSAQILRQVNIECATENLTHSELAALALEAYLALKGGKMDMESGKAILPPAAIEWLEKHWEGIRRNGGKTPTFAETLAHVFSSYDTLQAWGKVKFAQIEKEQAMEAAGAILPEDEEYYHQMLSEVLHSGIEEYRRAIIANVEGWSRAAKDHREMQSLRRPGGNVDPTPVSKAEDPSDALERARRARELAENDRKNDSKPKERNPGDVATGS